MVSPEGTGTLPDRPKSGRGILLAIAALVIAAGFAVLGALSPAEQMAIETTTTTTVSSTTTTVIEAPIDLDNFDVGQIVTGEPLDLVKGAAIQGGYPLALVEHDGDLYVFMTTSGEWLASEGGLLAWHSVDGERWNALGKVIDDRYQVTRVIATDESLMAVGVSIDDGTLMLWESRDGVDWEAFEVGAGNGSAYVRTIPTAAGSSGDTTVVATVTEGDTQGLIEDVLREADVEVDLGRWGWGLDSDQEGNSTITVHGPLGILITEVPLDDLGLTDEERRILEVGYDSSPESVLWVHDPGSGWTQTVVEGIYGVETIAARPEGGLIARGWGNTGMVTATTEDGRTWTQSDSVEEGPWQAEQWGELLVGPDDMSMPELLISADGHSWEKAGLASLFPVGINWSTYPTAAGPGGVALAVSGSSAGPQIDAPEPTSFATDKGHIVSLDPMSGRMTIEAGDMSHTWHVYGNTTQAGDLLADLAEETIELLDPESGVSFGTVTFDEAQRAEEDFYRAEFRGDEHRALVFTLDGERWTIQDVADSIGPKASIADLMVGTDRLVAVVMPEGDWSYPSLESGFEIWTAPLP